MQLTPLTAEQQKALAEVILKAGKLQDNGLRPEVIILDDPKCNDAITGVKRAEMQLREQLAKAPITAGLIHRPEQREFSIEEIKQKIDKETLFLFAFVPFVIAEIAWDYADSCIDLCILMRITETKKLCRCVRELRREYDRKRYKIDQEHRNIETQNMEAFQEDYKQFFSELHTSITNQVAENHPGQCLEQRMLMAAAYSCAVVLRAVFKYTDILSKRIAGILGITATGSIIVKELRVLEKIIIQFAGEESIGGNNQFPSTLNPFVDTLVEYLLQSEIIELPCPIEE